MSERLEAFQQEMNGWRGDLLLTPTKAAAAQCHHCIAPSSGVARRFGLRRIRAHNHGDEAATMAQVAG
jgi:hypothetical protein